MTDTTEKLQKDDYPALYESADEASRIAQYRHFLSLKAYLSLLLIATVLNLYGGTSAIVSLLMATSFLATIAISGLSLYAKFDKVWYQGRAVAESVKTRSWRYMMRAEPYEDSEDVRVIRASFANTLKEFLGPNWKLGDYIANSAVDRDQISKKMDEIRSLPIQERIVFYRKYRIDEQRSWYWREATRNRRNGRKWVAGLVGAQVGATICVLVRIAYPAWEYYPTYLFIVGAGIALTWINAKRFSDLAESYSITAHEIGAVKAQLETVDSETQFSDFVKDAENAFSREHTQWLAHRDS